MPHGVNESARRLHLHPGAGRLLVACGLVICLALAVAVAWYTATSREQVIEDAAREMRNDAFLLAEEEERLLQSLEVVQVGLIASMREAGIDTPDKFAQAMRSRETHRNLQDRISGLPHIGALSLSDRRGVLLNYTREWPAPEVNDADRDFIHELSVDGAPGSFVSAPSLGKTTGRWTVYLSRRFDAADGQLIGFVVGTIMIDYFEQFYARLPLTGEGAFTLYRRDGMLIARYPHVDRQIVGRMFADTPNFVRVLELRDEETLHLTSQFDGKERLLLSRAMRRFPLFVTVSDSVASVLRAWRGQIRMILAVTALLELAIVGTMMLAVRQLRGNRLLLAAEGARVRAEADLALADERERSARTARQHEQRFDTAVNNMFQGLCMYDSASRILVANRRFSVLFDLECDTVPAGTPYEEVTRLIVAAGTATPEDMRQMRERRRDLVDSRSRMTFAWDLANGRTLMVTHEPMETGWLTTYEDITERREAESRIAHMARHDALTDLPNRMLLREQLEHSLGFARRGRMLALHCLDLDQFKAVNDTLGHPIGDALLREIAQRLRQTLRETDMVARLGGDEFALVQSEINSPVDATILADRLISLIEAPFEVEGHRIVIGTSIGIALAPQDGLDADALLKCADLALNRAKVDGRGVYRLFQTEMDAAMQARRIMELDLRQALEHDQLEVFYQPLIDARARRPAGFEALLRWRHPVRGMISPDQFIPLAEETGLIAPIGAWVLRQACAAAARWPDGLKVAVNLSAVQFKSRDLVATVVDALRDTGLDASRLELEITETAMLRDTDSNLATLHRLRDLGVQIAMDDFGTGYSSLSYLRRFPFDRIKIDQSFVRELGKRADCIAIVRAVTALGHDLGMEITAEGVETREQFGTLVAAGCTEIQGWLFSRAVPEPAVPDLLRTLSTHDELATPLRALPTRDGVAMLEPLIAR
jgi:diguanylate cyclase (GGDEF)-like protein